MIRVTEKDGDQWAIRYTGTNAQEVRDFLEWLEEEYTAVTSLGGDLKVYLRVNDMAMFRGSMRPGDWLIRKGETIRSVSEIEFDSQYRVEPEDAAERIAHLERKLAFLAREMGVSFD